jgi:DNA-binding response OmpR family regulator
MRAVLRRSNGPRHPRLSVRDLEIDLASRVLTLAGETVQLLAKEYELLVALAEDPERVFKKEQLLRSVWGFSVARTDPHSGLRRESPPAQAQSLAGHCRRSQRLGVGYRLVATAG